MNKPVTRALSGSSDDSSCVSRHAFVGCAPPVTARNSRGLDFVQSTGVQLAGHMTVARTGPCGNSPAIHVTTQPLFL